MKQYEHFFNLFSSHLAQYTGSLQAKSPRELYDPENYILSLGGKRVRPLLALVACDLFGKQAENALNSALSVELFHNFSLIHDDILDKAPLRRGQETVHTKWNTDIAILSGDVMLVKAFQVLQDYPKEELNLLFPLFSKTAIEVCEGQQEDMNFETKELVSVDAYLEMISKKTAVLLGCSLQMGAINAGANVESQSNIYNFGKHVGIAFQLMDDLLDAFADESGSFGKQVGGDILSNKKTFLLLKAFELANAKQTEKLKSLMVLKEDKAKEKIEGVLNIYHDLKIKTLCEHKADEHTQIAISNLDKITADTEKKLALKNFAFHLLNRRV